MGISSRCDEHVTRELAASIREAIASREPNANGFFIQFLAPGGGKPVRFGDWAGKQHLRLFRRGFARFSDDPVHERIICQPPYGTLEGLMIHDTVATEAEKMSALCRSQHLSFSGEKAGRAHFVFDSQCMDLHARFSD
jgi:hypothetical protein